ncbi:hypothetical protein [Rhodococcus qingshengii]|uniref:hypothetical protein n=1 Tax=Rhodococcus qingshengii TaxID=334542 RepID=UPI001A5CCA00|nr:hypothetical protein [Rhodococcus qingshengii]ULD39007.1 hypothetical protein JKI97_00355 [Rhodococcus qingshengii]
MTNVKLSPEDARRISAGLQSAQNDMSQASQALVTITTDLSVNGMEGASGRALAAKQEELHSTAEQLATKTLDRAAALTSYANTVESTQAESAGRANNI